MKYTKRLGLYIHVPFCASKCYYCDFYSLAGHTERIEKYVHAVSAHLREYGALCGGYTVDTIYFGGGTPSFIGSKHLIKLLEEVNRQFSVSKSAEITVEANPDSMDKKLVKQLKKAGVNRLSVGLQSADNDELSLLGRAHNFEQAQEAICAAQDAGLENISLDLMYGLPNQATETFLRSVDAALALHPAHLSCYGLKLEPGTQLAQENPLLPDDDIQADTYFALCEKLQEAGFEHYEISNWARPGRRSQHNSKYWDFSEYLGLGPAAHSYLSGQRFAFVRNLDVYCAGFGPEGKKIVAEEDEVPTIQRHGEYIMLRLRTLDGISEHTFHDLFDRDFTPYADKLRPFISHGLVCCDMGRWYLTERGFFVSNAMIQKALSADDMACNDN